MTIGVTGGIGSGKTTVCNLLQELGARVFFADIEAKRIMVEDPQVREAIIQEFGPRSYDGEALNRTYLAGQVFGDEQRLEKLNGIIHPRVHAAFENAKAEAANDGIRLLVKEAAIIFETGGEQFLDAVVVVHAPTKNRMQWVIIRDQATPEQVRARMQHQLPPEELCRRADYVIGNNGTLADLKQKVRELYAQLIPEAKSFSDLQVSEDEDGRPSAGHQNPY